MSGFSPILAYCASYLLAPFFISLSPVSYISACFRVHECGHIALFEFCRLFSCAFYILSAKATYCPPLSSRDITSFIGTMGESDSSMVFARTHHCLGRYSLLAHVQNHPGLPGTLDITISGMPCSRTPVRFHSLALTTTPYW